MSDIRLAILESGFGLGGWIPRALDASVQAPRFPGLKGDKLWMAEALVAAMEGIGRSSPNPAVGALLVQGGLVIGQGATETYGALHAERVAINSADVNALQGSTCYVTLEPCGGLNGKQPPCADALINAGITRVVVATNDPHIKAGGLGLTQLKNAGIEVESGCLAAEAKAWHFPFLAYQDKQSPIIIGKWAQTLDGHLADDDNHSQWISGSRSRRYTHWLRQKYDAIMVGVATVLHDKPRLTARESALPHARDPHKIIFDPSARLSSASAETLTALFDKTESLGPIVYWCTDPRTLTLPPVLLPYKDHIEHLPIVDTHNLAGLLAHLAAAHRKRFGRDLQSIFVEGGAQLLTLLMRADLLDACHIFVRAGILGGSRNRIGRLERGENLSLPLMQRTDYKLLTTLAIDDDVLIECVHRRYQFWS